MEEFDYTILLQEIKNIKDAARSKELSKLGDVYINLCYSLAKSLYIGKADSEKVNKIVLSEALKQTGLRKFSKSRSNSHDIADSAEAIVAYTILLRRTTIEEITNIILNDFKTQNAILNKTVREKREADISALIRLFKIIKEKLSDLLGKADNS